MFGTDYPNHDLVCPLPDGTPWPPDRFTDEYIAFTRRVIAREIRFHDLRHTQASELLRGASPIKTVSQRLGHANPTVTLDIYAHMMSGDDENAAKTTEESTRNDQRRKRKRGRNKLCHLHHICTGPKTAVFGPLSSTELSPLFSGGEGEIRTHGTLAGSTVFETAAFDHSATSPHPGHY